MAKVIINGDDLGLRSSINRSAEELLRAGRMSSASIMVRRDRRSLDDAVRIARELRDRAGFGLHLDLDGFFPFDETGCYGNDQNDVMPEFSGILKNTTSEIKKEISYQIEILISAGIRPSHIDGHHNIHLFPDMLPLVIEAARSHGITAMRFSAGFFTEPRDREAALERIIHGGIHVPNEFIDAGALMGGSAQPMDGGKLVTEIMAHTEIGGEEYRNEQHSFFMGNYFQWEMVTFHDIAGKTG